MSEAIDKKNKFLDLYKGNDVDVWMDIDPENEFITVNIFGRFTFTLDRQEFQELYNAVFVSKQVLKELDDKK